MRPEPLPNLDLEEHRELGREVAGVTARMHQLCDLVLRLYGPNNHAAFSFVKVSQELDRLCEDLQAQARKDLPETHVEGLYQR